MCCVIISCNFQFIANSFYLRKSSMAFMPSALVSSRYFISQNRLLRLSAILSYNISLDSFKSKLVSFLAIEQTVFLGFLQSPQTLFSHTRRLVLKLLLIYKLIQLSSQQSICQLTVSHILFNLSLLIFINQTKKLTFTPNQMPFHLFHFVFWCIYLIQCFEICL